MASIKKFGLKAISAFLAIVLLLLSLPLTALAQTNTYEKSGNLQGDRISEMSVVIRQAETSSVISSVTYYYEYDANGNIEKVYSGNLLVYQYAYDNLGQLIREDNYYLNKSYVYEYDTAGNLTMKKEYAFTTGELGTRQNYYLYRHNNSDWGDQLTASYNLFEGTQTIVYDAVGNPIIVGDYNGAEAYYASGYELSWDGRELTQYRTFTNDGEGTVSYGDTITYTYNADGIRTSKTVNGIKHEYYLSGSQIMAETWTENGVERMLIYLYDESGSPIGLKYRTANYPYSSFDCFFFEKNIQGDIVAIYDDYGECIGRYHYDAWGNFTVELPPENNTSLENKVVNLYNPFRYRGYYYDVETGWYYLQSRYYNPTWGRFLNPDSIMAGTSGELHGHNLYAYCFNNPILMTDSEGEWPSWKKIWGGVKKFFKAVYRSIEFDAGVGFGLGAGATAAGYGVKATAYADTLTVSFDDGQMSDLENHGYAGGSLFGIGIEGSYTHNYDYHGDNACGEHSMWSMPWDVASCPHAETSEFSPYVEFAKHGSVSGSEDVVISFSVSAHVGVGGHINIGFNVNQFMREMGWD